MRKINKDKDKKHVSVPTRIQAVQKVLQVIHVETLHVVMRYVTIIDVGHSLTVPFPQS